MILNYKLTHPDAVHPTFAYDTDSGFDIAIVEKINTKTLEFNHQSEYFETFTYPNKKSICATVEFYRTGLHIQPEEGYYVELFPRSSITKLGYMLANSVGVLDESYVGEIIVPLIKFGNYNNLKLPMKVVQGIVRKRETVIFAEQKELKETLRGSNGFGSTSI